MRCCVLEIGSDGRRHLMVMNDELTTSPGRRAVTETPASLGGVLKRGAALSAVGLVIAQAATIVQTLVIGPAPRPPRGRRLRGRIGDDRVP